MPILSVIVPTHNRSHYALPTIEALLRLSDEIEIVVSDTSPEDRISPRLPEFEGVERVRYTRPPTDISVVDNFNIALGAASGDYVIFIGDDDLVSSHAVSLAYWAKSRQVDSLCFSFPISYYWPDFKHQLRGDFYSASVRAASFAGTIAPLDAASSLRAAAAQLGVGVLDMPRAYAGMMSMALARRIADKYGALFGGVSPDIYSAALIAFESTNCQRADFPIVIPGNSGASTAGQSANGGHRGKLRDNAHIGAFRDLVWDDRIPEFYSVPTVWSFSLVKALEKLDKVSLANFGRLYIRCLVFQRTYRSETLAAIRAHARSRGRLRTAVALAKGALSEGLWIVHKIYSMTRVTMSGRSESGLQNIDTTGEASRRIEDLLRDHPSTTAFNALIALPEEAKRQLRSTAQERLVESDRAPELAKPLANI
jgi:glycosyltransferase involved in cell wall biosynthesis